jgi:hypothetical protein
MKQFRLPRKQKKKIREGFYLYPLDPIDNTYLSAFPKDNQEDYDAFKKGVLTNILDEIKEKYGKTKSRRQS